MRVGRTPNGRLIQVVRMNQSPYTVHRRQGDADSDGYYGESASGEYSQLAETRQLYLYAPQERTEVTEAGQVVNATLNGYALPSVDVQPTDRVDHGGVRYELDTKDGVPDDNNPDVYELRWIRV